MCHMLDPGGLSTVVTLPARLAREAGYQTKAVGKMHFAPSRSRYGFEHVTLHPDDYLWWLEDHGYGGAFRGHGLGGNEVYPTVATTPDKYYHTTWAIDEAIRFLDQRDPNNPFCLFLVFEAPHSPFDPPVPYDRMYDNFTIPDPVHGDWTSDSLPVMFQKRSIEGKLDYLTPEIIRETRRRYYGQISQIDYHLGRLFGALNTRGLNRDTAIVFTADHGESLGDHGQFAKHSFLQSAARVPLILRLPPNDTRRTPAEARHSPVLTADICPTLLNLAGLSPEQSAEGISLLPVLQSANAGNGRVVFGETPGSAAVNTEALKYIFYAADGCEQLFDVKNDPDDMNNLIASADRKPDVDRLRAMLIAYLQKNASPLTHDGKLVTTGATEIGYARVRSNNPAACRGPMRGGMGY